MDPLHPLGLALLVTIGIYWFLCLSAGVKYSFNPTARDYFIANRSLSTPILVAAITATSFGWTFISHPGLVYLEGFSAAYASFYAITIPLAGVFFLKRQWMLGKRCGFVTPGEMLGAYYQSKLIRFAVVGVALLFSLFYLAVQLRASGFLFNILTQDLNLPHYLPSWLGSLILGESGALTINAGIFLLSIVLLLYVVMGGLRAVAWMDTLQFLLLAVGIVLLGWLVLKYVGGPSKLFEGIDKLQTLETEHRPVSLPTKVWPELPASSSSPTESDYNKYTEVPGAIQSVSEKDDTVGSHWTGVFILTFLIALMGIQSSPEFSMWAFSAKTPRAFASQQVVLSAFIMGGILIIFTTIQGIGAHLLGADIAFREQFPELSNNLLGVLLNDGDLLRFSEHKQELLVPLLIRMIADTQPWLTAGLALCALAAIQSTAAPYMSTFGSIFSRDLISVFFNPKKISDRAQINWARAGTVGITGLAAWLATHDFEALVYLGSWAVAFGLQMAPALLGLCWFPFFTGWGILIGMPAGIAVVFLTDPHFLKLIETWSGITLPWGLGGWPLTIHSAVWGLAINLTIVIGISWVKNFRFKNEAQEEHRRAYHKFFKEYAPFPSQFPSKKWNLTAWLTPMTLSLTLLLVWALVFIGPLTFVGNRLFENNVLHMPSIWIWQIIGWIVGVIIIWNLAYNVTLSTDPIKNIEPQENDVYSSRSSLTDIKP